MRTAMNKLLLLFTFFSNVAIADLLEVDKFDMRAQKFSYRRDPYTERNPTDWVYRAAMDFNLSVAKYGFWENELHMEAVEGAPKTLGWHWFAGARLGGGVDAIWEHHSQHVMEEEIKGKKFPIEDSFGIRLKFVDKTGKNGIFD